MTTLSRLSRFFRADDISIIINGGLCIYCMLKEVNCEKGEIHITALDSYGIDIF